MAIEVVDATDAMTIGNSTLRQSPAQLTIRFFGAVQLLLDGRDLTVEIGAKPLALLAYLAVAAPRPVPRTQLAGLLWSDKAEEAARYRLRHLLWELRRLLGKEHIQADDEYCRLGGEGLWVDVIELQQGCTRFGLDPIGAVGTGDDPAALRALTALYQGDFLGRLKVREAPLFEEWMLVAQERFQLLYQHLLSVLAQAQQTAGDEVGAGQTLLRLIEADPLREQSYRALMLAYGRSGDRAAALRVYEQCKARLARELAVPPAPETEALRRQIATDMLVTRYPDLDRALRLLQSGRYEEALAACRAAEALTLDATGRQIIALLRAEIAVITGRADEARLHIQAVRQQLHPALGTPLLPTTRIFAKTPVSADAPHYAAVGKRQ